MMELNGVDIVDRVKQLLQLQGKTVSDLYQNTSVTKSNFSRWNNALSLPNLTAMLDIAHYLDVSVEYLATGEYTEKMKERNGSDSLTRDQKEILELWNGLNREQQQLFRTMIKAVVGEKSNPDSVSVHTA